MQVAFIMLDDNTGKEKRTSLKYLVCGKSVRNALSSIENEIGKSMADFEVEAVCLTKIVDVFRGKDNEKV